MGADHKGPLAAFVVIAIIAAVLLVTSVRSQADEGWLAVHRLITGHRSSTLDAGSTPAGVRQPAAAPTSAPTSAASDPTGTSSATGAAQATAPGPTSTPTSSTTSGHTSGTPDARNATRALPGRDRGKPLDTPGSPFPSGLADPSGLPDPMQQAFGPKLQEPFPPVTDATGSVSSRPDLRWPFGRPQWFLGSWSKTRWLSLLDAHEGWYTHHRWHAHHHWSH